MSKDYSNVREIANKITDSLQGGFGPQSHGLTQMSYDIVFGESRNGKKEPDVAEMTFVSYYGKVKVTVEDIVEPTTVKGVIKSTETAESKK